MVGVGVELAAVRGGTSCKSELHDNIISCTKKKNLHCKYCNLLCRKFKFTMAFLKTIGSFAMATASLLFVMLEVESGLSGGEESISRGPSLSLTSVGVCRA